MERVFPISRGWCLHRWAGVFIGLSIARISVDIHVAEHMRERTEFSKVPNNCTAFPCFRIAPCVLDAFVQFASFSYRLTFQIVWILLVYSLFELQPLMQPYSPDHFLVWVSAFLIWPVQRRKMCITQCAKTRSIA